MSLNGSGIVLVTIVEGWGLEYWLHSRIKTSQQWPNSPRYVAEYVVVGRKDLLRWKRVTHSELLECVRYSRDQAL